MRKVKRSDCAILHLVLKKKWYDMIAEGKKYEEYRLGTQYWQTRIRNWLRRPSEWRHIVAFSCGYRKPDMFFTITANDVFFHTNCYHPDWGEPHELHFTLQIGQRVELED
jgi:hypothetical protein